ncbi:MAG: hypothetical protein KJO25_08180 [Bacteroidia bacterium]|nr:hypothetical protein [Bacteroidia bacterium]
MKRITFNMQPLILVLTLVFSSIFIHAQVGIGTLTPTSTLEVDGNNVDAIYGHSNNVGGYLGRETNITIPDIFGGPPQTILGSGVFASNPTAGYTSMFGQSTGAATIAAGINYSDVWIASYNFVNNSSAGFNPPAMYGQLNVNNATLGGFRSALTAYSDRNTTAGNPGYTVGGTFVANAQNEDSYGSSSIVYSDRTGNNSNTDLAGGEFVVLNYAGTTLRSLAYVANYLDLGPGPGGGLTDFKIFGTGTVSTMVEDDNKDQRVMFAPEAPEVLFQDFGVGELVNGQAEITLDPVLSRNIFVDETHPMKVFIQLEGDCNGVYVTNKSVQGFTVKELQNGTSDVSFSWQIVANRKDRSDSSKFGSSSFQNLRFPKVQSQKKMQLKDKRSLQLSSGLTRKN